MHGIPGLRFWDSGSRDKKRGTHNFVIWNNDAIKMLGIMPDSNPEAIKHFNDTAKLQETNNTNETYNQFIGEKGINNLATDGRFSALGTAETLNRAKELDAKHMPASFIWKSTGWIKGKDGEWRTEIPDGKLSDAFMNNPKRRIFTLKDIYDNDILYSAYPNLASMLIFIKPIKGSTRAYYTPDTKTITINKNSIKNGEFNEIRLDLIHEIQHAIQDIEGFEPGSTGDKKEETKLRRKINKLLKHPNKNIRAQLWTVDLTWAFTDKNNPEDLALLDKRIANLTEEARAVWQQIQELRNLLPDAKRQDFENYKRNAGEVEARNSETRANWDMDKRRNTPPTLSENTPRSKQILNGDNNTSSGSFLTPEKYDQLMQHGTRHILLGNRFDLRYLNTGEGRQFYGYGIYLSENSDVAEYYKKVGMSDDEIEVRDGNHYLVDGPENDTLLDWDATLSEQPKQILDILKKSDWLEEVYGDDYLELPDYVLNLSGERFYKDLGSYLNDEIWRRYHRKEDPYMLASMKLNELGIPGLRYFDSWSRDKKSNTHNFVIWNTDTLRLLGLTNDSEQDAHDYYSAEDYSSAYLDSRDNDSDVVDYSDRDYDYDMAHFDDIAEAHSDALDDNGFNETYKQSASDNSMDTNNTVRSVYDFLTPEAKRQVAIIHAKYHGTPQWLKAPNGEDTNLTELQWLLVRTPNFKRWFGDWEFNTDNASKIVDDNGEPRIVYHGSPKEEFSVFKTGGGNSKTENTGAWFTSNIQAAKTYFNDFEENSLYPVFLNIRNPYIYNAGGRFWDELGTISIINRNDNTTITADKNGNPFSSIQEAEDYIRHHFNGNERNYYAEVSNPTTTDKIVREIKSQNENYDGIIFKDILDTGEGQNSDEDFYNEFSFEDDFIGDDFVVFLPNNIKSATRNNGEYSLSNDEIYKQFIGETGARAIDKANGNTNLMDKFRLAQQMKQHGIKPRTIKRSTGWELGIEGKWKFELQDGQLYNPDAKETLPLREFYDNPELFNAYPMLNDINVAFDIEHELFTPAVFNPETIGYYDKKNKTIHLQSLARNYFKYLPNLPENDYRHEEVKDIKAWLVSQIQRLIQPIEGFALSRSQSWFKKRRVVQKIDENGNTYNAIAPSFPAVAREFTAGETEAVNAGRRADFTPEQRRNSLLTDTEDLTRDKQLIIQNRKKKRNFDAWADDYANTRLDAMDNESETYRQTNNSYSAEGNNTVRSADSFLTTEAQNQIAEIRRQYQGTSLWMKAPNGKKSNLNELQWLLVRTPNFKRWFGDWENDKENSSKVVDKNGEPLVVYHGSESENFSIFDTKGKNHSKGAGVFFSDSRYVAETFVSGKLSEDKIFPVFLNIRNPYTVGGNNNFWSTIYLYNVYDNLRKRNLFLKNNGSNFQSKDDAVLYISNVLNDPEHKRYTVKESYCMTTDDVARLAWKFRKGHNKRFDGVIIRNVYDIGYPNINGINPISDEFIIPKPNQIKSATRNNGEYSTSNDEFYKQTANDEQPFYGIDADGRQLMLRFNSPEIDAIYEKHKKAGTLFLAPNGKKSNLPERAWLLVRTPAFKAWFGDWENNPQDASKVIDKNGEPLIVTHQTGDGGFSTFDTSGKFAFDTYKTRKTGAWFADLKGNEPHSYAHQEGISIYHVFLNIRKPYIYDAEGKNWADLGRIWIADEDGGEPTYYDKDGKPFLYDYQAREYIRTVLHSNPRYYYEHDRIYPTTDDLVRAVRNGRLGYGKHDGVIIKNVQDFDYDNIDDYVIFAPIQVKSRNNNGAFSLKNTEIYKQSASDRDMDRRYFDALNAGDMDTARSIVDEQARRKGYSTDNEHRGQHQPATSLDGFPNLANIMNSDLVPADYWTHPQYYLYSPEEWDAYYAVTHAIRNKKPLTVYRAVPDDVKETVLRNGDWVTPSRDYAIQHGQSSLDGKYRIISAKVGLNRLWWDGNSIAELGYDDGKNYVYRNTKNSRKLNDTVVHGYTGGKFKEDEHGRLLRDENGHFIVEEKSREFIVPPSKRFNYRKSEEYYQTANNISNYSTRTVKSFLTLEAKKQVEAIRAKFYGTNLWLKAPNGEQSNLNELQWLLIRTPNFKQWFGDWENNPQDASKVLDDNGEPLIVYHAPAFYPDFSIFHASNSGASKNTGSWFNSNKKVALTYNVPRDENYLYAVFLNIRNPFILDVKGRNWDDLADVNNMGYKTSNEIVRGVWNGDFGYPDNTYYDGVILKNIKDNVAGHPDFIGNDYIVPYSEQIKSATRNNGNYDSTSGWRNDIYKQSANIKNNPLIETYRQVKPFSNPMSEAIYRRGQQPEKPKSAWQSIKQYLREIRKGFRGDFPLLAGQEAKDKGLTAAREILRIMNRNTDAKSHMVMVSLYESLHGLNSEQFDIFSRLMLINDIYAFKKNNPDADLPMEFTPESLKADRDYLVSLAKKDKKILNALLTEDANNKKARQDLVNLANELGFASLAKRLQSTDLFLIQYAKLLGGQDFNTNYVIAIADMRTTMLQDLERLLAVKKLKEKDYDKKAELIRKYGAKEWKRYIPKGYSIFNPLSGQFIQSAHSLTENVIGVALEEAGKQLGLSDKTMSMLRAKLSDKFDTQDMVLPDEITQTLDKLTKPNERSPLYKFAKTLTNGWKKYVLYFPTRVWKYNLRNITGDLDAALAGDPTMIRFFPQAFSELTTAFYGDKTKISSELKEFQARGGALTFRSAQDLLEDRQFKEASKLIADLDAKGNSAWKNLPRNAWKLLDKFLGYGIQKLSDFREQWIRYAVYLDYLHQMQQNNGIPNNLGASDKDEVMSIDDIRDRAFKMANELIGAYDQISETGKSLRDLLIPFYSWMEVNAKRYWQLLKNGFTEEEIGDFAQRFLKGHIANIPYYTYKVGKTLLFINLFSILVQAFNNFFWPDDEEKLPPEIRERPHLVFGHDSEGNVLYFRDIGSLFDLVDWFGLDTFRHDIKQIFNGQQTVTGWLKHISSAPFAKLVNGLTPLIKTPIELLSGQSYYPDITNPRKINDRMQYLAQSFGLTWPLKLAKRLVNGYNYSNWQEFRNLFIYAQDAEQAAYFYTLSLVNQFRENVLGEKFSGYSTNKRTQALRDFKTALRLNDKNAVVRSLNDYYSLEGTDKGLKTSMRNMHPLHSLNDKNKQRFLLWISQEDRAFIQRAEAYYNKQLKRYDEAFKEYNTRQRTRQSTRSY